MSGGHPGAPDAVALTRCESYDAARVQAAVRRQFSLLGLREAVRPGMRVALKPNLLMKRSPERFTTTHPMVAECCARELLALGAAQVVIADSPGGTYTRGALEGIYRACGMEEAARRVGERLILNQNTGWKTAACAVFERCSSFNVILPVLEADLVINLPKLKTHGMTTLSCAVKNLFGCVPGLQKPELHCRFQEEEAFCEMLVDLAQNILPAFTIVDAVDSMEGDGPSGGTRRHTGFLAGARNPFALDAFMADLTGLSPVQTVVISSRRGLTGPRIDQLGDGVEISPPLLRPRSKMPSFIDRLPPALRPAASGLAEAVAKPRPRVSAKRCVGCGKCAESCPVQVIRVESGRALIQRERCIRCFCCHEMCPVRAIEIRRLGLWDW